MLLPRLTTLPLICRNNRKKIFFMHKKSDSNKKKSIAMASGPNYWCIWIDYNSEKLWKCKICCVKCDIARGDLRVLAHCHFPKMGLNEIFTFNKKQFLKLIQSILDYLKNPTRIFKFLMWALMSTYTKSLKEKAMNFQGLFF